MSTETVAMQMGFSPQQAKALEDACIRWGIGSELQKSHFLGQVAHESASGKYLTEIASGAAYEGRGDLGNTQPGDGRRYKGRGLIQITGRSNYREYSLDMYGDTRLEKYPEQLAWLPDAATSAAWFWTSRGLNHLASEDDVRAVTKRINGGYNGLADRVRRVELASSLFQELRNGGDEGNGT